MYKVKDYDTYTRSLKYSNPYSDGNSWSVNSDVSKLLQEDYLRSRQSNLPIESRRSNLDRVLDLISAPLYITAGAVKGVIDPNSTVLGNMWGGLKASNPFGQGYEKGETTYSKVLETAGWKPTSTVGKIAKGTLGFLGDVFLDPTTYLTFGGSALVKGTGKAGLAIRETEKINELAKGLGIAKELNGVDDAMKVANATFDSVIKKFANNKNINPDLVAKLASKKSDDVLKEIERAGQVMTQDTAESIIKSQVLKRGTALSAEEITRDATKLTETYNKLAGVNRTHADLTLSLANAPFGKKIFKGLADKSITLGSADGLAKVGDMLNGKVYAKLRDSIYGSKLGELFSSKSALYKASKQDPGKVYDFLKFTEYTRGLTKDQLEAEKLIREKAKAMSLTPSETKEVLELMQDKSVWNKVTSTVKFLDTKEAQQYKEKILKQQSEVKTKLDDLNEIKKNVEALKHAKESELLDVQDALKTLEDEHASKLYDLDTTKITKSEDLQKAIKMYQDELTQLEVAISDASKPKANVPKVTEEVSPSIVEPDDFTESINMFDGYKEGLKQRDLQRENHKTLIKTLTEASDQEVLKAMKKTEALDKPISMSTARYEKMIKDINISGKVSYVKKSSAEEFHKLYPDWEMAEVTSNGVKSYEFIPPKAVTDTFKKISSLNPAVYDSTKAVDKIPVVRKISEQLFGKPDVIKVSTWDSYIDEIVNMMRDGVGKEKILEHIEKNARFYNGKAPIMYPFISEQLGYKNWDEAFTKPIEKLYNKISSGKALTAKEQSDFLKLQQLNFKRQYLIKMFDDADGISGAMKIVQDVADRELNETMRSMTGLYSTSSKGVKSDEEIARAKFIEQDSARNDAVKDLRYQELIDNSYDNLPTGTERQVYIEDIFNRIKSSTIDKGKTIDKAGEMTVAWVNKVADEIDPLLKDYFKKSYQALSPDQQNLLYTMAMKNANAKMEGAEMVGGLEKSVAEGVAKEVEKRSKVAQKEVLSETEAKKKLLDILNEADIPNKEAKVAEYVDNVVEKSEISADVINKRDEVFESLNKAKEELKVLDVEFKTSYQNTVDDFVKNTDELKAKIKDIEETKINLDNAFKVGEGAQIDELTRQLKHMDDVLSSDDALETFLKSWLGDSKVEDILAKNNPNVGKFVLDTLPVSEKVKKIVKTLSGEFHTIGLEEVAIGKLSLEQFENMTGAYITHILTEEGKKLFESKNIEKIIPNFGDDLGYGRKFNQYSLSRKIHDLPDGKGGFIHNPTIEQINEFFKPMVQGKNVMSENIADIYLARAMKHTELMYDDKYMKTMMDTFGKTLEKGKDVEEGYKAVANYGQLKKYIQDQAKLQTNIQLEVMKTNGIKVVAGDFKSKYSSNVMQLIEDLGLDPHVLDDVATPMVELSKEQIARVQKYKPDLIKQVNDAIVQKANQSRKLQIAKDQSRFLQIYDKFTHFIKLNQTTVLPSFHIRNKFSNTFNNWLNIGADAVNVDFQKKAFQAIKNNGEVTGALKITKADGTVDAISWKDLYENAKKYGVVDEGYFAKDVGAEASSSGIIKKLKPKYDPTDTKNFILYKKGAEIGSLVEGQDRLIHFASEISRGKSFEEATESVNKFLFDYSDLTSFEANVMKRIIPYYTWMRKNASLQLKMMIEQPKKYQYVSKVLGGINGMTNEEDRMNKAFVNDFAQDWVQLPFSVTNPEGKQEPVMLNPNLPFMDVSKIPNPLSPVRSALNLFTQTNPLIKTPVEEAINRNVFFDQPIVKEGDNPVAKRADHVASQFALYGALGDLINKSGADRGLQILNNATGIKAISYDYDKYKAMKIQELLDEINGGKDKPAKSKTKTLTKSGIKSVSKTKSSSEEDKK